MKTPLTLLLLLAALLPDTVFPAPPAGDPAALVIALVGTASAIDAQGRSTPLRLFDKLSRGTVLQTGADSGLKLFFAKGGRFALGANARARVEGSALRATSGVVTRLAPLPATLALSLIAPADDPGERFPTYRIRTQELTGIYPRGAVTLEPERAILRFNPVGGQPSYLVRVTESRSGDTIYSLTTTASEIQIPADRLKPGRRYQWQVETVGRIGPKAEGTGGFLTYTSEAKRARADLDKTLAGEPELDALLVKIAVDLNLGRFREVYEGLREAARKLPEDSGLAQAARTWGVRLEAQDATGTTPLVRTPSPRSPAPSSSGERWSW